MPVKTSTYTRVLTTAASTSPRVQLIPYVISMTVRPLPCLVTRAITETPPRVPNIVDMGTDNPVLYWYPLCSHTKLHQQADTVWPQGTCW